MGAVLSAKVFIFLSIQSWDSHSSAPQHRPILKGKKPVFFSVAVPLIGLIQPPACDLRRSNKTDELNSLLSLSSYQHVPCKHMNLLVPCAASPSLSLSSAVQGLQEADTKRAGADTSQSFSNQWHHRLHSLAWLGIPRLPFLFIPGTLNFGGPHAKKKNKWPEVLQKSIHALYLNMHPGRPRKLRGGSGCPLLLNPPRSHALNIGRYLSRKDFTGKKHLSPCWREKGALLHNPCPVVVGGGSADGRLMSTQVCSAHH